MASLPREHRTRTVLNTFNALPTVFPIQTHWVYENQVQELVISECCHMVITKIINLNKLLYKWGAELGRIYGWKFIS
jgi:hypothetical protein